MNRLKASDYLTIAKNRGYKNALEELIDYFLIDFYYGIETAPREKDERYVPIYTKVVKRSLSFIKDTILKNGFKDWIFIDIGCGKGKVLFCARKYNFIKYIGIEISERIYEILHRNVLKLKTTDCTIICKDVKNVSLDKIINIAGLQIEEIPGFILFAYNPFDVKELVEVICGWKKNIEKKDFFSFL